MVGSHLTEGSIPERLNSSPSQLYMNESGFWQSLRRHLTPRVYALKLNVSFVGGVPDAWLSGSEQDLWMENKYIQSLSAVIQPEKLLTTLQSLWLEERYSEGRWVGVLIGSSEGHVLFPGLSWKGCSISKMDFVSQSMTTKEMADHLVERLGEIQPRGVE